MIPRIWTTYHNSYISLQTVVSFTNFELCILLQQHTSATCRTVIISVVVAVVVNAVVAIVVFVVDDDDDNDEDDVGYKYGKRIANGIKKLLFLFGPLSATSRIALLLSSFSNRGQVQNHSYGYKFYLHVKENPFYKNDFALGLGLERRLRAIRKQAIRSDMSPTFFLIQNDV